MIQIALPGTAVQALSLDDTEMQREMDLTLVNTYRKGRSGSRWLFEGSEDAMRRLHLDMEYRLSGAFDMPSTWRAALRRSYDRLERLLKAAA